MPPKKQEKDLKDIPVRDIDRNPENPRLYFRQQEIDRLTDSIRRIGVQVPIAVYKEGGRYVLLDGERRWKCSLKLNRPTIPAIVQEKPDALTNLVLMFNIHALREQWDLLTIALKLPRVIELYESAHGKKPNERELSEETALTRSTIRRCKLLMDLPSEHVDIIKAELKKPKSQQKLSEDFYIEMERSLTTVSRAMPDVIPDDEERERVRHVLLDKYRSSVIKNLVDLRQIGKIARASNVYADTTAATEALGQLFQRNDFSIQAAYDASVCEAYRERDFQTHIKTLLRDLAAIDPTALDDEAMALLKQLVDQVRAILGGRS